MPPMPPEWLSPTEARGRCIDRSFAAAGLRRTTAFLPDGATIHLWIPLSPSPRRRKLLLLHGFGASATWQWRPFIRPLMAEGFDLYIPDLLFFGGSTAPIDISDRTDSYQARCVMAAADAVGLRRFALVGISYGGFVAYRVAAMYPAAVERVVLVAAGVCLEERDLADGLFPVSDIGEAASLLLPQRPEQLQQLAQLSFTYYPPFKPNCFNFLIRDYIRVMCTEHLKEKTELLYALISGRKLSDLPKITQPVFIIWGEKDRVFPLELAYRLERHLGDNAELVIVKDAGHSINREKPRKLCRLILDFLCDPVDNYYDDEKMSWKNFMIKFTRPGMKRVDSGHRLL